MSTKKKVATKVAGKKAVNTKKTEPAKKAGKPVLHTATNKSLAKHASKPPGKKVLASSGHTKKATTPVTKHIEKSSAAKPSKTPSKTAIPLKTEQVKTTPKKLENKSHENKSHENKSHENKAHENKAHDSKAHESKTHESKSHESKAHENKAHESKTHESKSHEIKSHDNNVSQPSPPPAAKQAPKKEAPVTKSVKEPAAPKPVKEAAAAKPPKVSMPDIKTKTVRKYEPDFTKSVLDTPMQDQSAPSQRYSDTDLNEFRDLINKKLDAAKKELNYLQGLITRKDEMGGDESDNRYMTMEDGSISMEREQLSQMASRQITFIDHLEKAIMRIENKTYGICRVTGKLIDKARLRAVPHATLSIEAKQTMNK